MGSVLLYNVSKYELQTSCKQGISSVEYYIYLVRQKDRKTTNKKYYRNNNPAYININENRIGSHKRLANAVFVV